MPRAPKPKARAPPPPHVEATGATTATLLVDGGAPLLVDGLADIAVEYGYRFKGSWKTAQQVAAEAQGQALRVEVGGLKPGKSYVFRVAANSSSAARVWSKASPPAKTSAASPQPEPEPEPQQAEAQHAPALERQLSEEQLTGEWGHALDDVGRLMELGFARVACEDALRRTDGDLLAAAEWLATHSVSRPEEGEPAPVTPAESEPPPRSPRRRNTLPGRAADAHSDPSWSGWRLSFLDGPIPAAADVYEESRRAAADAVAGWETFLPVLLGIMVTLELCDIRLLNPESRLGLSLGNVILLCCLCAQPRACCLILLLNVRHVLGKLRATLFGGQEGPPAEESSSWVTAVGRPRGCGAGTSSRLSAGTRMRRPLKSGRPLTTRMATSLRSSR